MGRGFATWGVRFHSFYVHFLWFAVNRRFYEGNTVDLDTYTKDAPEWRDSGYHYYRGSKILFESGDVYLWFPAATLGHYALEKFLKAVLIQEGMTVCNPREVNNLDPALGLRKGDCVWGHTLVDLAKQFAAKRPEFNLTMQICCFVVGEKAPMSLLRGFEIFDPFFSELRYPQRSPSIEGLGECHGELLDHLYKHLEPFLDEIPPR